MDLDALDHFNEDSSYDELRDILKGSNTRVSQNGDEWSLYERALEDLDYLKASERLESVDMNTRPSGLVDVKEARVTYSTDEEETDTVYFRAVV